MKILSWIFLLFFTSKGHAYTNFSHERITRGALNYLRTHTHTFLETDEWARIMSENKELVDESLVRSVVDTDYKSDMWLGAIFHESFSGGIEDGWVNMFTTLTHFMTIGVPGTLWENNGFSYKYGSKSGRDNMLNYFSLVLKDYNGSTAEWRGKYPSGSKVGDIIFPPANVPAEKALEILFSSKRATASRSINWDERLALISGIFKTEHPIRHFWRGEIKGLPVRFDQLGVALHMIQDMTVPHHSMSTSDLCHHEYEFAVDNLACPNGKINYRPYHDGSYFGDVYPQCESLYDEKMITRLMGEVPALRLDGTLGLSERMQKIAEMSHLWSWQFLANKKIQLKFPDGNKIEAESCTTLMNHDKFKEQVKYQYNLAIAASVSVFESVAYRYESAQTCGPLYTPRINRY